MATFELDSEFVRKLAELLGETGLTEIEYAEGEKRIRLSRAAPAAAVAPVAVAAAPVAAAAPAAAPVAAVPPAQHPGAVKSPMVGTAYLAPEPGAGTFVKVGDAVKVGQTLLIIEAMKVMNPIKATKAGTVTQIQVGDAQPVEYGEVLLIIE
ncbi:acetyl-CoA carboxylase biotin carboxyl carrier protein [Nitrospirillum amazonense]|uniref:Biotin carboxyl carrier protein of acetyl-CoA carboxylase n=2 Tax=Nitrospirillum TaxID=1543705 RepID=A0A560KI83_9PROT|nr:acetyl-CoA carboxylase biotin carboxyl carrier protein [Nitrospirillum amazonense]MDG3444412.1 acetyl-CoA carboxylase biotin carboxyl carrier protein [Nitrospirillum amazonense]TWB82983.1 acetyl-CoA carboxylase biotin carboxyl carrier protein [Nitrospirillum amazonense]